MAAVGDLTQASPANTIDIANLAWKQDADPASAYSPMVKLPAETIVSSNEPATNGRSFFFDYRLAIPPTAVSGNYTTTVVYTAYPQ